MDVCVVLYRNEPTRIRPGVRVQDTLLLRDNTQDNLGFAAGANAAAALGTESLVCFVNPDGDLTTDCLDALERTMNDPSVVATSAYLDHMTPTTTEAGDAEWLPATCLVVRRSAFESVQGFDERLFMYGEDGDLSRKLRPLGRLVITSEARFPHDWGHSLSLRSQHRIYRNHLVVQKRDANANAIGMIRDGFYSLRCCNWAVAFGRFSGTFDYMIRARHW